MALHHFNVPPENPLITPFPTAANTLLARQDGSKFIDYPACLTDPSGPCKLYVSSSDDCKRKVATMTGFTVAHENLCRCTNGYYDRFSECRNDCVPSTRTRDVESISRQSRIQELNCESWSLGIAEDEARLTRTVFVSNRTSGTVSSATSGRKVPGASVGATAPANAEETASWLERPGTTGQAQQGTASSIHDKGRLAHVLAATFFLILVVSSA